MRCVAKLRAHTAPVCALLCAEKSGLLISASDDSRCDKCAYIERQHMEALSSASCSVAFWKLDDVLAESSGETVVRPWHINKSIHHGPHIQHSHKPSTALCTRFVKQVPCVSW
jgi:hypothetical protein